MIRRLELLLSVINRVDRPHLVRDGTHTHILFVFALFEIIAYTAVESVRGVYYSSISLVGRNTFGSGTHILVRHILTFHHREPQ